MNTFVIKVSSFGIQPKIGKCIGNSEDKKWTYYIYYSHKYFKDSNPDIITLKNWEVADLKKEQFDFCKYNICPVCGGLGAFHEISFPKRKKGTLKSPGVCYDEDGFVIFGERVNVYCVCNEVTGGDKPPYKYIDSPIAGTYVGYLEHEHRSLKRDYEHLKENYNRSKIFIMNTSTCKTCRGHSETMYDFESCPECGLTGSQIFIIGG